MKPQQEAFIVQFYSFPSTYCTERHHLADDAGKLPAPAEFYAAHLALCGRLVPSNSMAISAYNQLFAEDQWYRLGRPYYNFHPRLTPAFARSKLDFPVQYVQLPYRSMAVQFADQDPLLQIDDQYRLRSCLVCRSKKLQLRDGSPSGHRQLGLYMDFGETLPDGRVHYTWRLLQWDNDGQLVEKLLDMLPDNPTFREGVAIPKELTTLCIKLVCSIAFLAKDESPLVTPHILRRDMAAYAAADAEQRQALVRKASQTRGQIGHQVGCDEVFDLGHIGPAASAAQQSDGGNKLQWAQIVTGHWRLVRYGPGRQEGRIRWIMPFGRGKGLPFKHVTQQEAT